MLAWLPCVIGSGNRLAEGSQPANVRFRADAPATPDTHYLPSFALMIFRDWIARAGSLVE